MLLTRVSSHEQEDGHSLAAQNARLIEYAKRKNLEVLKTYQIVESSTRGKRKEFMEMIEFCKAQSEIVAIVSDAVDRVQRSFKESVLLDELMRQDKIELHFYREGMVIGKNASSTDILRWDFSVMSAKAYVLQLSENVKRSLDYKIKRGEVIGVAPMGYENFVDSTGKHSVRPKHPDATHVKELFELYSLGGTSMHELARIANRMGLRTYSGNHLTATSVQFMLDNTFYYGEMRLRSRGIQIKHVYEPLITRELWERCQEQRKLQAAKPFNAGDIPFLYRGVFQDYNKHKTCPCEIKKKKHTYVVSYKEDGTRIYTAERLITNQILSILSQITIPPEVITKFKEYVQSNQQAEVDFINAEIERLKSEIAHVDSQLNRLFELRMSEEISKKEYQTKKADYNLQKARLESQLQVQYRGDDGYNATVLSALKILSKAKDIFSSPVTPITDKQMLLHFLFSQIILKEGVISCVLNKPFSFMFSDDMLTAEDNQKETITPPKIESCELVDTQGFDGNFGAFSEGSKKWGFEPHFLIKKQGLKPKFKPSVSTGWGGWIRTNECRHQKPMPYHLATPQL